VTTLLLWRHGQTASNVESRIQGQLDVPLTEVGRRQAAEAALRLAGRSPEVIVSSDLQRAAHTAAALAEVTGLPVATDVRLRERHFGEWQGHTAPELRERWPDGFARWRQGQDVDEAGVESIDDLTKRVATALREIVDRDSGRTIVVVTHGGAARRGLGSLLGWPEPIIRTLGELGNCHFSELRHHPEWGWKLVAHNVG
jgi:glucosyl-3-phosphoglycerate phosphatase